MTEPKTVPLDVEVIRYGGRQFVPLDDVLDKLRHTVAEGGRRSVGYGQAADYLERQYERPESEHPVSTNSPFGI